MKFEKDIVSFDLETTGLSKEKDFIIQLAAIKFNIDDTDKVIVKDKLNLFIKPVGNYTISWQAYFKHGIKPEFLADKPVFSEVADQVLTFIGDCDLLTFNGVSFDIPFLEAEFNKCGKTLNVLKRKCYDSFREEKRRYGNKLSDCYKRYIGKTMEDDNLTAHNAYSDVAATIKVFQSQQVKADFDAENMITDDGFIEMKEFQGEVCGCFAVGKYRDISIKFVKQYDPSYINWVLNSEQTSKITKEYIESV